MGTVTAIGMASVKLVGAGICLGFGFWLSKKLTNQIDYFIIMHDKKFHEELANPAVIH